MKNTNSDFKHSEKEMETISNDEKESLLEDRSNYKEKIIGTVLGFVVVLMGAASGVSVQLLERRIPDMELNTMRSGGACILFLAVLLSRGRFPHVPRSIWKGVLVYTLVTSMCSVTIYVSMAMLPAGTVQSLQQTFQITSGIILFALILKEKITIRMLISSLLCIAGIFMVIQPDFLFHETSNTDILNKTRVPTNTTANFESEEYEVFGFGIDQATNLIVGCSIAAISGVFVTLDVLVMKYNTSFKDFLFEIPFFSFIVGTLISIVLMLILESPTLPTSWTDVAYIVIHTTSFAAGWPLYIYILRYISANTFNIIWSTITVFMLIAQYTVLSSILPGHRNWMEVVGVLLVTIGSSFGSIANFFFD